MSTSRSRRLLGASVAVWLLAACAGHAPSTASERAPVAAAHGAPPASGGRLPGDVTPLAYRLELEVDPRRDTFSGKALIRVRLERTTNEIWMHGRGLRVRRASITTDRSAPCPARWAQRDEDGLGRLSLDRGVGPGEATVEIEWDAPFGDHLDGLYKVSAQGVPYAFTQFEAVAARKMFPCFDEPAYKTPFDVSVRANETDTVVANARVVEARVESGRKLWRFATTERLPTYLVALAVGPLEIIEAPPVAANEVRARPLPLRGVAVRGHGRALAYALRQAAGLIVPLERYFGVSYPFDKLDLLSVPDFEAGAMENAGAITFRDKYLEIDERSAPAQQKRSVAAVLAHELAHQWVGNLVTMRWWDDLWLNEAMATWAEPKAVQAWQPETRAAIDQIDWITDAMDADSLQAASPVRHTIRTTGDIDNAFDDITYAKGSAVLSMVERWIGPPVFQRGIRAYLARHRFGTTTTDDLIRALSETSGRDVGGVVRSFVDRPGLPLVEAHLSCGQGSAPRLELAQSRYAPLGSSASTRVPPWDIPVCVRYGAATGVRETCALLGGRRTSVALEGDACPAWVFPNSHGSGYYRFVVDARDLDALRRGGLGALDTPEKLILADSVDAAFRAGKLGAGAALATMADLARDRDPAVAAAPIPFVSFLVDHGVDDPHRGAAQRFVADVYGPRLATLGWEAPRGRREDDETRMLRARIVATLALVAEEPHARARAAQLGRAYLGLGRDARMHPEVVESDAAETCLVVAAQGADAELFDVLLARLATIDEGQVRDQLLRAIGSVRDPALAARARAFTLDERLRDNEAMLPLRTQMNDYRSRETAWRWVAANLPAIVRRVGNTGWQASSIALLASSRCTDAAAREARDVLGRGLARVQGAGTQIDIASESIEVCSAIQSAQRDRIVEYLTIRDRRTAVP